MKSRKSTDDFSFFRLFLSKEFILFEKHKKAASIEAALFRDLQKQKHHLFENCDALRAFLRPGFFLSFIRASRVRKPAVLSVAL